MHIYIEQQKNQNGIAKSLELNDEDIVLAELIGLLHDIGRFEQAKKYNTFLDKISINHAEYGVKILFEDNLIRKFIEDNQYDEIIEKAILNHNKAEIESIADERVLLHCKIIRDADKLDIFNVILNDKLENVYPLEQYKKEPIAQTIKEEFIKNHLISYSNAKSCVDFLVGQIAFVFNMNFLYGLKKIYDQKYVEKIIKKFDAKDEETLKVLDKFKNIAKKYMQDKIKEGKICLKNY